MKAKLRARLQSCEVVLPLVDRSSACIRYGWALLDGRPPLQPPRPATTSAAAAIPGSATPPRFSGRAATPLPRTGCFGHVPVSDTRSDDLVTGQRFALGLAIVTEKIMTTTSPVPGAGPVRKAIACTVRLLVARCEARYSVA